MRKIHDIPSLTELVVRWRREGKSIVFTNGCFDILHEGHLQLIKFCKKQGDALVVAINSDESVSRLKGAERPVTPQSLRAEQLAALSAVDAIIVFDDDTPLHLINTLKPDVLVKGGDYTLNTVVGAQEVISRGGRVEIFPRYGKFSTSSIIASRKNK